MSDYPDRLRESADLIDAIPLEHVARGRDRESFMRRLVTERGALEILTEVEKLKGSVAIVVDGRGDAADILLTLRVIELQSHPRVKVYVAHSSAEPSFWMSRLKGVVHIAQVSGSFKDWIKDLDAEWLILAQGGDILHPGLAAVVAMQSHKRESLAAITWNRMQHRFDRQCAEVIMGLRTPGLDSLALGNIDYLGRSIAWSRAALEKLVTDHETDPFAAADSWRLKRELADCHGSSWFAHPEFLASYQEDLVYTDPGVMKNIPDRAAKMVSVIIPFRDRADATLAVLRSIARQRTDSEIEVILVDNQSSVETIDKLRVAIKEHEPSFRCLILPYPFPFNHSRQSNMGARSAKGEVLLFLNNDAELQSDSALDIMARWALVEDVATVGGRILNAQGALSSAGFRVRLGNIAVFDSMVEDCSEERFSHIVRECIGNSFACVAVSARVFDALGGLDEVRFPVGYNDIEFCLRAVRAGYRHVYAGNAIIRHSPGGSRGKTDEAFQKQILRSEHAWILGEKGMRFLSVDLPGPRPIRCGKLPLLTEAPLGSGRPSSGLESRQNSRAVQANSGDMASMDIDSRIPDIIGWSRSFNMNQRPWLILGKGPSFSRIRSVNLDDFFVCSLNHVVREAPVTAAHMIDLDVVEACQDILDRNARYLILPVHPHVQSKPSTRTIFEYAREIPILGKFAREGRLVWYNAATSKQYKEGSPVIDVKYFSSEAALGVLAACGVRTVRSLGVDGGSSYSETFRDLNNVTLLINGHDSFDKQFGGIAKTIRKTGVFYAPLHVEAPVKVFVGTDAAQMLGVKVLEYSIKKYASMSVQVEPIDDRKVPVPRDPANRTKTGFSFSRFLIPELCGHRGRGIYLDADMQLFTDIARLWTVDMAGAHVLYAKGPPDNSRPATFSVMLLDCEALKWDIRKIIKGLDEGTYDYKKLMGELCIVPPDRKRDALPFEWNSLEHYEEGKTCLIHYTDMPTQPWVSHKNRNGHLFYSACKEALDEGFISKDYVLSEVARGHVSPDLPRWIGMDSEPGMNPKNWVPPYRRFVTSISQPRVVYKGLRARVKKILKMFRSI